jgi:hypothetical protein
MKTLIFLFLVLILTGCTKKNDNDGRSFPKDDQIVNADFNLLPNASVLVDFSLKSSPEELFDHTLYQSFLFLDSLLTDEDFYLFLIDEDFLVDTNEIQFTKILNKYNDFSSETVFSDSLIDAINNDSTLYINDIQYLPLIYIPNLNLLDEANSPIVAFGSDLELVSDSLCDIIYGRYYNSQSNLIEIEVDESNGTQSEVPILVLTSGINNISFQSSEGFDANDIFLGNNSISTSNFKSLTYPYLDEYRINYRYDESKRSEYHQQFIAYTSAGYKDGGWSDLIKRIHKDDVNKTTFYTDYEIMPFPLFTYYAYWYVTFEYDWYAGKKEVQVTGDLGTQYVRCRMKYSDEWYQRGFFYVPQQGSVYILLSTKGHCKIITQP